MEKTSYQKIYERQAAFYKKHAWAMLALKIANPITTVLIVAGYLAFCLIVLLPSSEPTKWDFLRVLGVPALCFITASCARIFFDRKRPYERTAEEGGIEPIIHKTTKGHSFPSRHAACAFVIGTAALAYLPLLGVGLLIVGLMIGYIRFTSGVHFPTDLLMGALWGTAFGLLAFI
ncbi:MAG: phosphatase PAP2 family protein [Clostridia bacterium]|nr:phosphatase PAP2 family protein [Clostridia bacterium]